jgi:predicted RNA binding protein YcfA (HicA-like mRNA interferase family)
MSPRTPRVTASEIIRVLEKIGFGLSRQSGSHKIYKNSEGRRVTVPFHAGKVLHPKVLRSIQEDAGITPDEFAQFLKDM